MLVKRGFKNPDDLVTIYRGMTSNGLGDIPEEGNHMLSTSLSPSPSIKI